MGQNAKLTFIPKESILRRVLRQFDIPDTAFSIGSPAEQRVCLEKTDDTFHVYVVERGIKFDESQHQTEAAAHFEMLHQLAATDSEYHKMRGLYKQILERNRENPAKTLVKRAAPVEWSRPIPNITVGDTVRVCFHAPQGLRKHNRVFKGIVVSQKADNHLITVRRMASGVGVEKQFSLFSPEISKVEIVRKGKEPWAKLNSLHKQKRRK